MLDLVIVGNIAFDVNRFPLRDDGQDLTVTNVGGAGFYSLLPASLFSGRVGIVARVGQDFPLDSISRLKVNTAGLRVMNDVQTTRFFHTYLSQDGQDRSFHPAVTPEALISAEDIPSEYFAAHYIHISTNFPQTQIACIERIRRYSDAVLSIDTHEAYLADSWPDVLRAFNMVDVAFIDRHEEELIAACTAPRKIIKRGKDGIAHQSTTGEFCVVAKPCEVVDKTGAGDVLAGVFLTLR